VVDVGRIAPLDLGDAVDVGRIAPLDLGDAVDVRRIASLDLGDAVDVRRIAPLDLGDEVDLGDGVVYTATEVTRGVIDLSTPLATVHDLSPQFAAPLKHCPVGGVGQTSHLPLAEEDTHCGISTS
jgi:hypothetical protein